MLLAYGWCLSSFRRPWFLPAILCVAVQAAPGMPAWAQDEERPDWVTDSAVARGERIFHGPANCASCHGEGGRGTDIGPDLSDDDWIRGAGTYDEIAAQVMHGVPRNESRTDTPMPMRGWTGLDDDEVRAVAAYVWTLSKRRN